MHGQESSPDFHPGQYNQVGAKTRDVFEKTILDLGLHAKIFDIMGMGIDSIMVIHGGGVYGNKTATIDRWKRQFMEMLSLSETGLCLKTVKKVTVSKTLYLFQHLNILATVHTIIHVLNIIIQQFVKGLLQS